MKVRSTDLSLGFCVIDRRVHCEGNDQLQMDWLSRKSLPLLLACTTTLATPHQSLVTQSVRAIRLLPRNREIVQRNPKKLNIHVRNPTSVNKQISPLPRPHPSLLLPLPLPLLLLLIHLNLHIKNIPPNPHSHHPQHGLDILLRQQRLFHENATVPPLRRPLDDDLPHALADLFAAVFAHEFYRVGGRGDLMLDLAG